MFIGVFIYSFSIGSLSSVLSKLDKKNSQFNYNMSILNDLKKKFPVPNLLYQKLKNQLKYGNRLKL